MPIPTIVSYPMPTECDLPPSVAFWTPSPERACVLIHDMQQYFVDFLPAGHSPTTELVANIGRIRRAAARLGMPVFYTAQPGSATRERRGLLHDFWGPGMTADESHRAIVADLAPWPGDTIVAKFRYSAFHSSGLAEAIRDWGRDQLVICGVYAHVGVLLTACDAFAHDIETFVVADAVADFSLPEHRMALDYAARQCAVTMTTDRLLSHVTTTRVDGSLS